MWKISTYNNSLINQITRLKHSACTFRFIVGPLLRESRFRTSDLWGRAHTTWGPLLLLRLVQESMILKFLLRRRRRLEGVLTSRLKYFLLNCSCRSSSRRRRGQRFQVAGRRRRGWRPGWRRGLSRLSVDFDEWDLRHRTHYSVHDKGLNGCCILRRCF